MSSCATSSGCAPLAVVSSLSPTAVHGTRVTLIQLPALLVNPQAMWVLDPATSSGAPGSVAPVRSRGGTESVPATRSRAWYQTAGTRCERCMSLATSAAPVLVTRPVNAQLLLPATGPRGCGAALVSPAVSARAGAAAWASRTSSTSG